MREQLYSKLRPPVFADDESNRIAALVHMILVMAMIVSVGSDLITRIVLLLLGNEVSFVSTTLFVFVPFQFGLLLLLRRGKIRLVSILLCLSAILNITIALADVGFSQPMLAVGYLLIVGLAGLILDAYWTVFFAVISLIALWGVSYAAAENLLPAPPFTIPLLLLFIIYMAAITLYILLLRQTINRSSTRANQELRERRRIEQQLQQRRALTDKLMETSPAGILYLNNDFDIIFANPRAHEILRILGPATVTAQPLDLPDIPHLADLFGLRELATTEKPIYDIERYLERQDGETVSMSLNIAPNLDQAGTREGLVVSIADITEFKRAEAALRNSEEKYRSIVENALAGIFTVNEKYQFIYVNEKFGEILGYPLDKLIGMDFRHVLAPSSLALVAERYRQRQRGEDVPARYELEIVRKDGQVRQAEMTVNVVHDPDGEPRSMGQLLDITDRKLAEQARERLISELEAKNSELERFTYTVSHDLKSPLITIQGFLGFLEQDALSGDTQRLQQDVTRIREATDKMRLLLEDLLELSRIGRVMNTPQYNPYQTIVDEALKLVAGRIEKRQVQVSVMPDLPIVYGDGPRLIEVVQNLLDNAIKFMGDQPAPRIDVGVRYESSGPVFFVRDNGKGILPAYHDKVFDLFDRLDPSVEGTGIGLTLVKRIVKVHGGDIWVESAGANQGSTFCFTLPGGSDAGPK